MQRLTWCQLKSAGVQNAKRRSHSIEIPDGKYNSIKLNSTRVNKQRIIISLTRKNL